MQPSPYRQVSASLALAGWLAVAQPPARPQPAEASGSTAPDLLADAGRFSPAEIRRVDLGEVMVRVLPPAAGHEVAIAGALRLAASKDAYLELGGDVERQVGGSSLLQWGTFDAVPDQEDVASLRLDETEFAALRRCARGDCTSKLAALALEPFRALDWSAPGAKARAEALVRAGLAAHVRDYAARGDAALMVFDHARFPTSLAVEFRGLLSAAFPALSLVPELVAHLGRYPVDALPGSRSALWWSRATFGLKPVIGAYHVVTYRPPALPWLGVVVSKQFFASRYFDATLEVALALDDPDGNGRPGCRLLYLARSRVDSLRGTLGSMKRSTVEREAREALLRRLVGLRTQLDRGR